MENNNDELELFLQLLDQKIESINLNLEKCQKIVGDAIDDLKKFQSGLMPDSELKAVNEELDWAYNQEMKLEELNADTLENL